MGQPKFQRKHHDTPSHPWQGERIKAENEVKAKFGLKSKTELWKAQTVLRDVRGQARGLISRARNPDDTQGAKEASLLISRLQRSGYLGENATLNEVLAIDLERVLNRRLQSQVYLKGLARTPKQARQFISHGCIKIGERRVTVPSYNVRRGEEELIMIDPTKAIADEAHPVRPKAAGMETPMQAPSTPSAPAEAPAGSAAPTREAA
ncbi:MAG TPA: 30S ribosomal protein S4 [Candidatus Thermoplasmatota archaeon]|nr:30S ribosomal protein S4 [Candidatus Thermoplasmatota archaeon]